MKRFFDNSRAGVVVALAAAVLLPLSLATAGANEVIVAEDFSSGGSLGGRTPSEAPSGAFWQTGDGDRAVRVEGGSARARLGQTLSAVLETGLGEPGRYTLSMEVEFPPLVESAAESWVALGFSENKREVRAFNDGGEGGAAGSPWMLLRWRGSAQVFAGPGVARPLGNVTEARYLPEEKHLLRLVIDTRDESWTLEAFVNGEPVAIGRHSSETYTFTRTPTIRYIGFAVYTNGELEAGETPTVQIRNFRLEKEADE